MLIAGLVLATIGVLLWPAPWTDPRSALWRAPVHRHARQAESLDSPATDVAIAARLLAIALATGVPIQSALAAVAAHSAPDVCRDLHRVLGAEARGADTRAAWSALPDIWDPVAAALTVATEAGVAPSPLLRAAATAILRKESAAREAAIGRVSVRLVLPLAGLLLPAFMCTTVVPLILVMTRGYLQS